MSDGKTYKNILIIKPGAIGDLIQLTPVISALKGHYPDASVTLLVGSLTTAELFKYNKQVQETIVYDKKADRSLRSLIHLWSRLRKQKFDLVINFQRSNLRTWFLASSGFPCRVLVYHKNVNRKIHAVANYLETLAPLGFNTETQTLLLPLGDAEIVFADAIAVKANLQHPIIALNAGASHAVNRWPSASFARLADRLARELSASVIIIGGPEDVFLAEEIAEKADSNPLVLTGKTNLLETAALLKKAAVLVTGDTGPLHLATAVGTRVVALFGAADPARTGPLGEGHIIIQSPDVSCVPCRSRKCGRSMYAECMERISVDRVFEAVVRAIAV